MITKIREICEKQCGKKLLEDEELLTSNLLASFQLLSVIYELESIFQIEFEPDEIGETDNFNTINNIEQLIRSKLNK